jgi:ArsR family transcriptional regulator
MTPPATTTRPIDAVAVERTSPAAPCCTPLAAPRLTKSEAAATATLFKALADPARVRLIHLLATSPDPVCVCDLTAPLGLSQPTVSHHLRKLREAGLVDCERRGTWAYYWVERAAMARLAEAITLPATPSTA